MKNKNNKKAFGTVQATIISVIIIAVAFGILLIFLRYLPYRQMADREACHDSVILRSNQLLGGLVESGKAIVPLKCKTQYITIKTSDKEKIKRIIADQMYDCWWMLGEGKYDFFPWTTSHKLGYGLTASPCMICSVIKFEGQAKNIENIDIVDYLVTHIVPGKNETYADYFLGQENTVLPAELNVNNISTDKDYAILFMGIKGQEVMNTLKKDASLASLLAAGGTVTAISMGGPLVRKALLNVGKSAVKLVVAHPIGALVTVGIAVVGIIGPQIGAQIRHGYVAVQRCDGSREGCYNLILMPFEAENITRSCTNIESIL